jgi:hypothetical protein
MHTINKTYQALTTIHVAISRNVEGKYNVYVDDSHYGTFDTVQEAEKFADQHIEYNKMREPFNENTAL